MTMPVTDRTSQSNDLRGLAIEQLRKRRGLQAHVIAFLSVNLLLVAIWYVTGRHFFWPVFPIFGWGIGLAFNAWDVYVPERLTEERIQREIQRLSQGR
jgi:2TM domain